MGADGRACCGAQPPGGGTAAFPEPEAEPQPPGGGVAAFLEPEAEPQSGDRVSAAGAAVGAKGDGLGTAAIGAVLGDLDASGAARRCVEPVSGGADAEAGGTMRAVVVGSLLETTGIAAVVVRPLPDESESDTETAGAAHARMLGRSRPAATRASQKAPASANRSFGSTASARRNTASTASESCTPPARGVGRRTGSVARRTSAMTSPSVAGWPSSAYVSTIASEYTSVHGPVIPRRGSSCSGAA